MKRILLISSSKVHGSGYLEHCGAEITDFLYDVERVLFVPFALADHDTYAATFRRRFEELGYAVDSLHEAADAKTAVADAEAIFIGGGNTFRLLTTLYRLDVVESIRARVAAGTPYMGSSAGSNVACATIKTTNDMPIVQPPTFEALALMPFQLNPHYIDADPGSTHMGETRETRLREFLEENDTPVVAIREGSWLRRDGDTLTLGGTTGGRLFLVDSERELDPGADLGFLLR